MAIGEFIQALILEIRHIGNLCLSLAVLVYGIKLIFSGDVDTRNEAKQVLLRLLLAFVLLNFSSEFVETLRGFV